MAVSLDAIIHSQQRLKLAAFPEEILDSIIHAAGLSESRKPSQIGSHKKKDWIACTLVCRRWRRIALPYLFRSITVHSPDAVQRGYPFRYPSKIVVEFLRFLSENPSIARLIEQLTFAFLSFNMGNLDATLACLPRLRYFTFNSNLLDRTDQPLRGNYKLEKVVYTDTAIRPLPRHQGLSYFLSIFSDIGGFLPKTYIREDSGNITNEDAGKLLIREALLNTSVPSPLFGAFNVCHRLDALRHLTCLTVNCYDSEGLRHVNQLLTTVCTTLGELALSFSWSWGSETNQPDDGDTVIGILRSGLSACTILHGFRLHTMVDSSYLDHDFDPRQHPEVVLQGWLLGLNVIALVNIPELRHLRFVYHYLGYSLTEAEIRAFSWSRLRSVCSRFSGLRTVETDIYHQDPLDPRCKVVAECARHELRDLQAKGVRIEDLHRLGFYCEQKSCRWYGRVGLS